MNRDISVSSVSSVSGVSGASGASGASGVSGASDDSWLSEYINCGGGFWGWCEIF